MNYTSNDTQCFPFKLFGISELIFLTVPLISVQFLELLIYNLLSLVSNVLFTKGEVLLSCQEDKNLLMSRLLRTYKRYDHETLKSNINFCFLQSIKLNRLEQEEHFFSTISVLFYWERLRLKCFLVRRLISKRPFPNMLLSSLCSLR